MAKQRIFATFCDDLDRWIFVMATKRHITEKLLTIGMTTDGLYGDDDPDTILRAAARWIKKIAPDTTGYEIIYVKPTGPESAHQLKNIIKLYQAF